jgi:putative DNA primase/helicase
VVTRSFSRLSTARMSDEMVEVIKLPIPVSQDADEHARADTQRKQRLFEWCDAVLERLRLDKAVAAAKSIEELRRVTFDADSAEITLAIRDALHPASGRREEHFRGLKDGGLKLILKNRFTDLKKTREAALRRGKQPDWRDQLILDKEDKIIANLANLTLILTEAPKWKGVLAYDEFNARVVIKGRPPWEEEASNTPWTDHHETQVRVWFQREGRISPSAGDVGRAVQAAARYNPFHPVRNHFEALVWDGVPRLESWLRTYFQVQDSEYVRAIGPRYLISAVARIYRPGCQVDHTLVLEGPQGKQKSAALRTLAIKNDWFTDQLSHLASKDAAIETAGVLLVEIAEMDALIKATASAAKSYLTRRYDRFRPPYGKHPINLPRQCVFAATINPTVGGYLKDPTGSRRFWPVTCRGMIDRDGLEKGRDQLWAEAVHRFKAEAPWWLETPELEALATAEQTARFVVDAWEEPIREWLGDRNDAGCLEEVLEHALGLARKDQTQSAQKRVVAILTHLGFEKRRPRTPEGRQNRYQRDPIPVKRSPIDG